MTAHSTDISWLDQFEFEKALRDSVLARKPVLLDFHDSRCTCCARLERETYSDPGVYYQINEHTIPVRVVTAEPDAVSAAIILCYLSISTPTVQLLSPDGNVYHWWRGAPRQTTVSARQYRTRPTHGYRRVYHEASGYLTPSMFLAQLLIARGREALNQQRFEDATELFRDVLTKYVADTVACSEASYWLSTVKSTGPLSTFQRKAFSGRV
jgi:hypothetical protein